MRAAGAITHRVAQPASSTGASAIRRRPATCAAAAVSITSISDPASSGVSVIRLAPSCTARRSSVDPKSQSPTIATVRRTSPPSIRAKPVQRAVGSISSNRSLAGSSRTHSKTGSALAATMAICSGDMTTSGAIISTASSGWMYSATSDADRAISTLSPSRRSRSTMAIKAAVTRPA